MNRIIILFLLLTIVNTSWACDLCSVYIGIQPRDFKSSIGFRYRYRLFEEKYIINKSNTGTSNLVKTSSSRLMSNSGMNINHVENGITGTNNSTLLYTEQYNSFDIVANLRFGKRFSVLLNTSFSDNYVYKNDSIVDNISGVGDLMLIANYRLFYTKIANDSLAKNKLLHRLTVGGGIELPTGSFNKKSVKSYETSFTSNTIIGQPLMELDEHLQPGTGSFNYLLLLQYMVKFNRIGLNNNISYKINTKNKNDFQFANRFNVNSSIFYLAKLNDKITLMPNTGLSYEFSEHDKRNENILIDSGGEALFVNGGLQLFYKNMSFATTYFQPVYNYLYGNQPSNKARIISQLSIYF